MNVDNFISFFNGIYCDFDGAYGDQCFDLANGYSRWIGGPRFTGATADLIINQAGTFYTRIDNAPDNFPIKGDVIVWNFPHVGIATGDNTDKNGFDALEQNDPTGSDCHLKHYNYNGVLGWLRPNKLPQGTDQATLDEIRTERDNNWNSYQGELSKNNELVKTNTDLQTQLQNLREAFDTQTTADANTGSELLTTQHQLTSANDLLISIGKLLNIPLQAPVSLSDGVKLQKAISDALMPHQEVVAQVTKVQDAMWENLIKGKITGFWDWLKYGLNMLRGG